MTNRREFLQIGIGATAWPLAANAAAAAGRALTEAEPLPIYAAVYDRRFEESRVFAASAGRMGLDVRAIEGDMTRLWYDEIYHEWRRRPVAIAGLTAHGPMFCFDQLGRDCGMRVIFRAEHRPESDGTLRHSLSGPASLVGRCEATGLAGGSQHWTALMAELVGSCRSGRTEIASAELVSGAESLATDLARSADVDALYTWVIAPAVRA